MHLDVFLSDFEHLLTGQLLMVQIQQLRTSFFGFLFVQDVLGDKTDAEVQLLMATPAEVFLAYVAVVRFSCVFVDCVG